MPDRIPPKLYGAMANEIRSWQEEGAIDGALASALLARYPASGSRSNAVTLLTTIGAVLVGLGTLLYIGANWQTIATLWKLTILIGAIIASHTAGWFFKFEPGSRPRLGSAFLLLGSFFYGGGIWLIAQMFNIDIHYPAGLLLWFIGTAASALITRSVAVGILSSLILGAWNLYDPTFYFANSWQNAASFQVTVATFVGLATALSLRSRAMVWVTLLSSTLWVVAESHADIPGLLMWGFALFGGYLWTRANLELASQPFKYVGVCSALSALLILTCNRMTGVNVQNDVYYTGLICAALVTLGLVAMQLKQYRNEAIACLLLMVYFFIFAANPLELTRAIAFNFMAVTSIVGLAWAGSKHLQSPGMVNTAIVFAVFYIICRYFDFFFSMMDRSFFFIMGGVVLMTIGSLAERGRRHLLGGMAA